jgi:AraC-like DNA-binding protein
MRTEEGHSPEFYNAMAHSEVVCGFLTAFRDTTWLSMDLLPAAGPVSLFPDPDERRHPVCSLVARTKAGCEQCRRFLEKLRCRCQNSAAPYQVQAFCGLVYVAAPVMLGKQHWATLLGGRAFPEGAADGRFEGLSRLLKDQGLNLGHRSIRLACARTSILSESQLAAAEKLFVLCARFLAVELNWWMASSHENEPLPVRIAKELVERRAADVLTVTDVARDANLSQRHFARLFKKATGLTFTEHVSRVRVERAKKLLGNRDLTIKEVAGLSGFQSRQDFDRNFKRYTGLCPGEYRRPAPHNGNAPR